MIKDTKIFSVIIPMYNGAGTIENALASLMPSRQFIKEVIIANDRSTDNCIELAHQFDSMLPMIYVNVPENLPHGPGNGRNIGIETATGEWLAFLDCDDMYSMTAFTDIYNAIQQRDDGKLASIITSFLQYTIETNTYSQLSNQDPSYMHGHFYKREFLNTYKIRNDPKILIIEDGYFNLLFNATCQEYDYHNDYFNNVNTYIWRVHQDHKGLSFNADPSNQENTNYTIESRLTCVKEILNRFKNTKGGAYNYALRVSLDSLLSGYFEYIYTVSTGKKQALPGLEKWNKKILKVLKEDFKYSKKKTMDFCLDENNFNSVKEVYELHFGALDTDTFTLKQFYDLLDGKKNG